MRVLIACVALMACSSAGGDEPIRRAPEVSAKPPGTGWACFRDSVGGDSLCARPDRCEPLRQGLAAEYDRAGLSYSLSPCTARATVACLTTSSTTTTQVIALCYELMSECNEARAYFAGNKVDYDNVSDYCVAW